MRVRLAAAAIVLLATLAAGVVPCPTPLVDDSASAGETAMLPLCPCSCSDRPTAAGVAIAPGLALFAHVASIVPPAFETPLPLRGFSVLAGFRRLPDPVPLG